MSKNKVYPLFKEVKFNRLIGKQKCLRQSRKQIGPARNRFSSFVRGDYSKPPAERTHGGVKTSGETLVYFRVSTHCGQRGLGFM